MILRFFTAVLLLVSQPLYAMPPNDVCSTAIPLSIGNCDTFDNIGAAASNYPTATLSCGETLDADLDVWFTAVVPPSGNLTIQTSSIQNNSFDFSMSVEVYRGASCLSLTPIACSHYTDFNERYALVEFENLTPDEVLFIRVADQGPTIDFDEFQICISDLGYTNFPCKIQYVEAGSTSSCDPVTNTFTQTVTIHYYHDSESISSFHINNMSYGIGESPMTIQIPGLAATGNQNNLNLNMFSYYSNECRSSYSKNNFFDAVANCYNGVVTNDNCSGAIDLPVSTIDCEMQVFDFTGANSSMSSFTCDSNETNPQDLWYKVTVPQNGELILAVSYIESYPVFEVYEGTCSNLNLIENCGYDVFSKRFSNRTPGETLYVRTANSLNSDQGKFGICAMGPQINKETCQTAHPLAISSECNPTAIFSTHFSIAEDFPSEFYSCSSFNDNILDIWFSAVVPSSGDLTISLDYIADSSFEGELFESNCSSLSSIDCQNGFLTNLNFSVANRTPGEILLLRVSAREEIRNTTFKICASSSCPDTDYISYPIADPTEFEDHLSITANNLIEHTADVIYDAGQYILLESGFEVQKLGIFHAYIDGCN